jgi:hypothetical protein
MSDKLTLEQLWNQQYEFMKLLQEKRGFPEFPVDITTKDGQRFLKKIAFEAMGEMFEAIQHLKQKDHRVSDMNEVNRAEFIEEVVDAQHYLYEILILAGVSLKEFSQAYIDKGDKNSSRINSGY